MRVPNTSVPTGALNLQVSGVDNLDPEKVLIVSLLEIALDRGRQRNGGCVAMGVAVVVCSGIEVYRQFVSAGDSELVPYPPPRNTCPVR